tara:strand:- start:612 stop:863 length:252 start_codon:yes stop_codon:yes gene_type:complete
MNNTTLSIETYTTYERHLRFTDKEGVPRSVELIMINDLNTHNPVLRPINDEYCVTEDDYYYLNAYDMLDNAVALLSSCDEGGA